MKDEKEYDVLVSVKAYARVSATSKEEAIRFAEDGRLADLFPNDIEKGDVVEISYGGRIFEVEN